MMNILLLQVSPFFTKNVNLLRGEGELGVRWHCKVDTNWPQFYRQHFENYCGILIWNSSKYACKGRIDINPVLAQAMVQRQTSDTPQNTPVMP